jgi:predicted membrane protein
MKKNYVFSAIFFVLVVLITISNIINSSGLRIFSAILLIIVAVIYFIVSGKDDKKGRR